MIWILIGAWVFRNRVPWLYQIAMWYVGIAFAVLLFEMGREEAGIIGLLLWGIGIYALARFIRKDQQRTGRAWWEIGRYQTSNPISLSAYPLSKPLLSLPAFCVA